jgi:uncharacterized membrane protein
MRSTSEIRLYIWSEFICGNIIMTLLKQALARAYKYQMYFLGVSGFVIAGLAVTYGVQTEDTVAALGALLFLPNAVVLLGIGLREQGLIGNLSPSGSNPE